MTAQHSLKKICVSPKGGGAVAPSPPPLKYATDSARGGAI